MKKNLRKLLTSRRWERRNCKMIFPSSTVHHNTNQPTNQVPGGQDLSLHHISTRPQLLDFNSEIPDSQNIKDTSVSPIRSLVLRSLQSMIQISDGNTNTPVKSEVTMKWLTSDVRRKCNPWFSDHLDATQTSSCTNNSECREGRLETSSGHNLC